MRWFLILLLASLTLTAGATAATSDGKFVFRDGQWIFVPADQGGPPLTTPPQTAQPPARAPQQTAPEPPAVKLPPVEPPSVPAPPPLPPPPAIPSPTAQPTIAPASETPPIQKPVSVIEAQPVPPSEKPAEVVPPLPAIEKPAGAVPAMPPAEIPPPPPSEVQPLPLPEKPAAVVPAIEAQPVPSIKPQPALPPEKPVGPLAPTPPPSEIPPMPAIEAQPALPALPSTGVMPPVLPTGVVRPMEPSKIPPPPIETPAEPAAAKPVEAQPAVPAQTAAAKPAESPLDKPAVARGPVVPANPVKPPSAPGIKAASLRIEAAESPGVKYRTRQPQVAADEAEKLLAALKNASKNDSEHILHAIAAYRARQWTDAAKTAALLLKTSPHSPCAEAAKWLQAEAIFADGDLYAAFETDEEFIKNYAGSTLLDKAMRREMEIAEAFLTGTKRRLFGVLRVNAQDEGLAILDKVYDHRPTGDLAPDALFRRAEFQMQKKKYDEAEKSFLQFAKEFPNHQRARSAELLASQAAMNYNMGPVYGDASLKRANDQLVAYGDKHPEVAAGENVPQALEKIRQTEAQKKYEVAAYYLRAQKPKAAVFYARRVIREYPDTPAEAQARALLRKLGAPLDEEQGAQP